METIFRSAILVAFILIGILAYVAWHTLIALVAKIGRLERRVDELEKRL